MYLASLTLIAFVVNTVRALSHEQASHEKTSRPIVRINSRGRVAITRRTDADSGGTRGRKERKGEDNTAVRRMLAVFFGDRQAYTDMHCARCIKYRSVPLRALLVSVYVAKRSERVPRHALPHAEA